jgi:hypothetical protein
MHRVDGEAHVASLRLDRGAAGGRSRRETQVIHRPKFLVEKAGREPSKTLDSA